MHHVNALSNPVPDIKQVVTDVVCPVAVKVVKRRKRVWRGWLQKFAKATSSYIMCAQV